MWIDSVKKMTMPRSAYAARVIKIKKKENDNYGKLFGIVW